MATIGSDDIKSYLETLHRKRDQAGYAELRALSPSVDQLRDAMQGTEDWFIDPVQPAAMKSAMEAANGLTHTNEPSLTPTQIDQAGVRVYGAS